MRSSPQRKRPNEHSHNQTHSFGFLFYSRSSSADQWKRASRASRKATRHHNVTFGTRNLFNQKFCVNFFYHCFLCLLSAHTPPADTNFWLLSTATDWEHSFGSRKIVTDQTPNTRRWHRLLFGISSFSNIRIGGKKSIAQTTNKTVHRKQNKKSGKKGASEKR